MAITVAVGTLATNPTSERSSSSSAAALACAIGMQIHGFLSSYTFKRMAGEAYIGGAEGAHQPA